MKEWVEISELRDLLDSIKGTRTKNRNLNKLERCFSNIKKVRK